MRHIVTIDVMHFDPVPWAAPHLGSGTRGDGSRYHFSSGRKKSRPMDRSLSLEDWKRLVAKEARRAVSGNDIKLLTGPVHVEYTFLCEAQDTSSIGKLWEIPVRWTEARKKGKKHQPAHWTKVHRDGKIDADLTNLEKSAEDALEGIVYANDCLCRSKRSICLQWHTPGVRISVYEIDPSDYPGVTTRSTDDAGQGDTEQC